MNEKTKPGILKRRKRHFIIRRVTILFHTALQDDVTQDSWTQDTGRTDQALQLQLLESRERKEGEGKIRE